MLWFWNYLMIGHYEWQFLSEINAVMQITNKIAMELQMEQAGFNCFAY